MRLFRRRERPGQVRRADSADVTHLTTFARGHTGVEAFVEPPTAVSEDAAPAIRDSVRLESDQLESAAAHGTPRHVATE